MTDEEIAAKYGLTQDVDPDAAIAAKYGIVAPAAPAYLGHDNRDELRNQMKAGLYGARNTATLGFYTTPEEIAAKQANPYAYMTGQVAGGMVGYPLAGAGVARVAPAVAKAGRSTLGALGINTGLGAVQGYNATDIEGQPYTKEERLANAAKGAAFGGTLSGIGSGAGKAFDFLGKQVGQLTPNANNVLRVTAAQANDIYNSTRIAAINRADQMYPGLANKVYSNGKGGVTSDPTQITKNIKNLTPKEQSVIAATHETALNNHPLAKGASNPNDIQRNLVDLNQQNPEFNNSWMRAGAEAGIGALGAGAGQWAYNKATDNTGGYGTTILGALGVPSLMKATGGRIAGPVTRYIAQKEANLAAINRMNTQPTSLVANRGITAFTGKVPRAITQSVIPGGASVINQIRPEQPLSEEEVADRAIAAKYGL